MQRIHPVTEQACREHCGKPVLIYLVDGTEVHGILSRVEGGKLILNERIDTGGGDKIVKSRKKAKTTAANKKAAADAGKARTTANADPFFGPDPYGVPPVDYGFGGYGRSYGGDSWGWGAPLALDLTAAAALFVLI